MISYDFAKYEISRPSEFVLHVQIDRPEKLNAFNTAQWQRLRVIFDRASGDPDVRVVVLSAAGDRAFTAGLDLGEDSLAAVTRDATDPARAGSAMRRHILDFQDAVSSLQRCAKPVIVCLHGLALGLGIDLAAAADVRYAARGTSFCIKEVDIGLAADIGSLQRLPRVVGDGSWLREMALTAATFDAQTALERGFVSKVLDSREACIREGLRTAERIAGKSPVAVQGTKFLLDYSREHTVQEGLLMTAVWNASMLQTRDVTDAIQAVLTKSPAKFSKL